MKNFIIENLKRQMVSVYEESFYIRFPSGSASSKCDIYCLYLNIWTWTTGNRWNYLVNLFILNIMKVTDVAPFLQISIKNNFQFKIEKQKQLNTFISLVLHVSLFYEINLKKYVRWNCNTFNMLSILYSEYSIFSQ